MPRFDSIFSSIKQIPDEWTQLSSTVGVKPGSVMKPLDCHVSLRDERKIIITDSMNFFFFFDVVVPCFHAQFILPINSSYSLSDTIPFHIQLLGSIGMLMELLPTSSSLFQPTQDRETIQGGFPIEVKIARQITVDIRGQKSLRTLTIGKGEMWPVPPDIEHVSSVSDDICLDWEGEAKCWKEVSCGGFFIGCVRVRVSMVFVLGYCFLCAEETCVGLHRACIKPTANQNDATSSDADSTTYKFCDRSMDRGSHGPWA